MDITFVVLNNSVLQGKMYNLAPWFVSHVGFSQLLKTALLKDSRCYITLKRVIFTRHVSSSYSWHLDVEKVFKLGKYWTGKFSCYSPSNKLDIKRLFTCHEEESDLDSFVTCKDGFK